MNYGGGGNWEYGGFMVDKGFFMKGMEEGL